MNYIIYIPTGLNSPMLEILLSEAQKLINMKKKVEIVLLNHDDIFACSKNIFSQKYISQASSEKIKLGLKTLIGNFKVDYIKIKDQYEKIINKTSFSDSEKFKNFKFENVDFGNAVFSSYVGLSRDTNFDGYLKTYSCKNLLISSLNIYFYFKKKIFNNKCKIILYNGRHNEARPIVRLCQNKKILLNVLEFSGDGEKNVGVRRFINHLPTDLKDMEKIIKDFWKYSASKNNKCDYYFKYKKAGRIINDRASYILKQEKKLLPNGWDKTKKNIVYFTSSQDEYSCLGGIYDHTIYKNQHESIIKIVNSFKKLNDKSYNLFIRCHPYLEKVFWKYNQDIINIHDPKNKIFVIKPSSPVSSYEMLFQSDKVITYNSQTGIEAVYWEKPSIILGRRIYENLNCVYQPKNHNDTMNLIFRKNLKAKEKLGALKFASYWVEGGYTYNDFTGSMKLGYKFKKKKIVNTYFVKTLYLMAKGMQYYFYNFILNYQFGKILILFKKSD
jgi:hypothetical protein|tara:strand:+ start:2569 stop:4065 length:1497 start_codon:yes stop_codon:yes gene_type:complete